MSDDFASLLGKASTPPDTQSGAGRDLPDGFPLPVQPHHRVVDADKDPNGIEGLIKYDFTGFRAVYLIYRPWEHCTRCKDDIGNSVVTLPTDSDYTCPHTDLVKYQQVLNRGLSGEYLLGPENEVIQKDGSIVISLKFFEKRLNPKKKKGSGIGPTMPGQSDEPDI